MNNDVTEEIKMTILDNIEQTEMSVLNNEGNIDFNVTTSTGTTNYERLSNKPQINSVELIGNKTGDELNLQIKGNYPNTRITNIEIDNLFN